MSDGTRDLTAIVFTDIVGYTALMEQDEAKAIHVRDQHRGIVRVLVERRIRVPTLVIHGREDRVVPLARGSDLTSLIPEVGFESVRGANHEQGAFNSPKTRELIAEFLAAGYRR